MNKRSLILLFLCIAFLGSSALAGPTSRGFDFSKSGPREFLHYLVAKLQDKPQAMTVEGSVKYWIREDDIEELLSMLDSQEKCLSVRIPQSGRFPPASTVGDQAAYLIEGFRAGFYPPTLNSTSYTIAQKDELRRWWTLYKLAKPIDRRKGASTSSPAELRKSNR